MDRSQYIYRRVVFSKNGDKISLVDLYNPDAEPHIYAPWLGLVVSLADGQHTIQDMIGYLEKYYAKGSPDNMISTIESAVERLSETGTVLMSPEPIELPYYLTLPAERLDVPEALRLMEADGYTREWSGPDLSN